MLKYYVEDYGKIKMHLEQEIKRFPQKEQELRTIYAPIINYHACRCAEQLFHDLQGGLDYALV